MESLYNMKEEHCPEHADLYRTLGNIEGKLDGIATDVQRINGSFGAHVKDSDYWRNKVTRLEVKTTLITTLALGILFVLIKMVFI